VWESIVVLNNSPVRVARMRMHLIMVLCDLVLEHFTLLFQMESHGFELSLSLPQLVHVQVGRDIYIRHS
jgi:hypothetical protein